MTAHRATVNPIPMDRQLEQAVPAWNPQCVCGFGAKLRCGSPESAQRLADTHTATQATGGHREG